MTESYPILEVNDLCKKFGGISAIRDLTLRVDPGKVTGLLGPNGSGKTTLFNLITGVYPFDSGSIRFCEDDISGLPTHMISLRGIGRTFQATKVFFSQSVMDNLDIALIAGAHKNLVTQRIHDRIDEVLELTSLSDFREKTAGDLSHSLQRRLMAAMALVKNPALLLLDEITAGMSGEECNGIMTMVKRIRESGTTVFMIEHNMRVAMALCDHIIVINFGEKTAEGTPGEITANEEVLEAYLGKDEY